MEWIDWDLMQKLAVILLRAALTAAVPIIAAEIRCYLQQLRADKRYDQLRQVVRDAVAAAEQMGLTEDLYDYAESKLDYAAEAVQAWLDSNGVHLAVDELRVLIESEVRRQFPQPRG